MRNVWRTPNSWQIQPCLSRGQQSCNELKRCREAEWRTVLITSILYFWRRYRFLAQFACFFVNMILKNLWIDVGEIWGVGRQQSRSNVNEFGKVRVRALISIVIIIMTPICDLWGFLCSPGGPHITPENPQLIELTHLEKSENLQSSVVYNVSHKMSAPYLCP